MERADVTKTVKCSGGIAKAWLWNQGDDLQACIRSCNGTRKTKRILVTSGIVAFVAHSDGSLATIVGRDYAKELDGITAKCKQVVHMNGTVLMNGEPLGRHVASFPHTFKRTCEYMVTGLSGETGTEVGRHIIQKVAMALVVHGITTIEWVSTLRDDQILKWLATSELAIDFIRPVRGRLRRQQGR